MNMDLRQYFEKPVVFLNNAAKGALVLGIFFTPLGTASANIFIALTVFLWLVAGGYKERFEDLRRNYVAWATLALLFLIFAGIFYSSAES